MNEGEEYKEMVIKIDFLSCRLVLSRVFSSCRTRIVDIIHQAILLYIFFLC